MRKPMKKLLSNLAFLSALEIIVYTFLATVAWAIGSHDVKGLNDSYYGSPDLMQARIIAFIQVSILVFNVVMLSKIAATGETMVALLSLIMAAAVASLFFLSTKVSVYGLGAMSGAAIIMTLLTLIKRLLFNKKAKIQMKPSTPSKKAS